MTHFPVRAVLLVLVIAVVAALPVASRSQPATAATAQEKKGAPAPTVLGELGQDLDEAVQKFDAAGGGFCGVVLVAADGKVLLEKGYGIADAATKRPVAVDALYDWASVTKQFTAAAMLRLQDKKKLKLDDPLKKFFKDAPKDKADVTLRQLLNHTSGIQSGFKQEWKFDARSRESFEQLILGLPMVTKPGAAWEYSNSGYAFAAAIVEHVSGKSWEEFLVDELFKPAGMKDACAIGWKSLDLARVPKIERGAGFSDRPKDFAFAYGNTLNWGYRGCGGVVATVHDMFLWDRTLRGDKLLSSAAKAELYRVGLKEYALGWEMKKALGGLRAEHSGGVLGVVTHFLRMLDEDVVVAIACSYTPKEPPANLADALARLAYKRK